MPEERIRVPNIGDARDVDVVEVLVKAGQRIEREQSLIVLETEKASMDIPSPLSGVVSEVMLQVGAKVSEGATILVLTVDAAAAAPVAENPGEAETKRGAPAPGVDARSSAPSPAPSAPSSRQSERSNSEVVAIRTTPPASPLPAEDLAPVARGSFPYASPAIRRFARELGVDLKRIVGSARGGRITKEDVQLHVKQALQAPVVSNAAGILAVDSVPEIDFTQFGQISELPLTKIQRLAGRNLHRSWVTIPHVTQFDEADITELEDFRKKIRASQPDVKLTLVTFFMRALVPVLRAMPRFNASLHVSEEKLILKHYFHIGVAVDTPNGLVVPVIRDVDKKSLGELAKELEDGSARARARRLTPGDLQGASMTISSLGGIGGTAFTPIINPPEVAILGVSRARWSPVYEERAFVPRLMCPLSLSYDHRVIDGADGARFTSRLRDVLGDIRRLLL